MGIILLDLPLMLLGENGQIKKYQILLIALIKVARRKNDEKLFYYFNPICIRFFMTFALSIFFDFILFLYFLKIKNIDFKLTINYASNPYIHNFIKPTTNAIFSEKIPKVLNEVEGSMNKTMESK